MNDSEREQLAGLGSAAAAYAIFRANDNMATAVGENAVVQGVIEGQHTQWAVVRNTGDERLGRIAGNSAELRTFGWWLAMFGLPFLLFLGGVGIFVAMGSPTEGIGSWWGPFVLLCAFVLMGYIASHLRKSGMRNSYARANLPTERELNRAGYYQVEPDVWFNPVIQRVITGHAYASQEAAQRRQAARTEEQQIRDLYRQQRRSGVNHITTKAYVQASNRWGTGGGLSSLLGPGANVRPDDDDEA
jgi:hypothetical protein